MIVSTRLPLPPVSPSGSEYGANTSMQSPPYRHLPAEAGRLTQSARERSKAEAKNINLTTHQQQSPAPAQQLKTNDGGGRRIRRVACNQRFSICLFLSDTPYFASRQSPAPASMCIPESTWRSAVVSCSSSPLQTLPHPPITGAGNTLRPVPYHGQLSAGLVQENFRPDAR